MFKNIRIFFMLPVFVFITSCRDDDSGPKTGFQGGSCYSDGTCEPGLVCDDTQNICILETNTNNNNVNNNNNNNNTNPVCGNNFVETGELCDGTDLGDNSCSSVNSAFSGGTLGCSSDCLSWDTSACEFATTDSTVSPAAEILQNGTSGFLLRGIVLTPDGVLNPGEVLFVNDIITCVSADCTGETDAADATWIDTHGIISPGLIDSHNHMAYDFLPEWIPPDGTLYHNRYEWADEPSYEEFILPYTKHRSSSDYFCPAAKWGELRALIHGTTTMQGQPSASSSCINWGIRNANRYHGLGYDHMRGTIASPRDLTDADAESLMEDFTSATDPVTRYHVHMEEGYEGNHITEEFDSFAGRDPRDNRHNGVSLLYNGTSILIHSVALTDAQIEEVASTHAKIVWSPSSNIVLYGLTAPVQKFLQHGITVGLGPDWTLSGEDDMLGELKYARNYASANNIPELTSEKLWHMSTDENALVIGLHDYIGKLEVGYKADITVFGRIGSSPYDALIDSTSSDVRLVFIGGEAYYGDAGLKSATARNPYCEDFNACGTAKFICVQDAPDADNRRNETMSDLHTQLYNILEGIGFPEDEQYGRGDELLELDSECVAK